MKKLNVFFMSLFVLLLAFTGSAQAAHFSGVIPTPAGVDFLGDNATINDVKLQAGDEIGVFDPEGVLCGAVTVSTSGGYLIHVYGDDTSTPNVDEGAVSGDVLTFKVWDLSAGKEVTVTDFTPAVIYSVPASPNNPPKWTADKDTWGLNFNAVPNIPPIAVANATPNRLCAGGFAAVTLGGSGSTDSDGTIASYAWTQTAGTTMTLSGASTETATFTPPDTTAAGETLTFQLTVTDDGGATDTATVDVNVTGPPVINSFTTDHSSICASGSPFLSWTVTGATSMSIDKGVGTVTGSSVSVYPLDTTTYMLTVANACGSDSKTVTVTVNHAPVISSFTATPSTICKGLTTTLESTVIGATSITIDNGVGTVVGGTVSAVVSPAATTTYTLTATNDCGETTANLTVVVIDIPVIKGFTADPVEIGAEGFTTLSWDITGATSLSMQAGSGADAKDVTGTTSKVVSPEATTSYILTASNGVCFVQKTVTVSVNNPPDKPDMISPADGATGVSLMPELKAGAYHDADGDAQTMTWWQIATDKLFTEDSGSSEGSLVYNEKTNTYLTSIIVPPNLILDVATLYYWRVRYFDGKNWSDSDIHSFTTTPNGAQYIDGVQKGDQIPDNEVNPALVGFADEHGKPVNTSTKKAFVSAVNKNIQIGVEVSGATIDRCGALDPKDFKGMAPMIPYMPYGLVEIALTVPNPGDTATVTVYFSKKLPDANHFIWWKFDPNKGEFYDYGEAAAAEGINDAVVVSPDRMSVTLKFKDGGYGDLIVTPDGRIIDPSGPGDNGTGITPTPFSVDFIGDNATINGVKLAPGDEIRVYDPDGVLCGATTVSITGGYLIHVYGDDTSTPDVDEGASAGDILTFKVWDFSDGQEITVNDFNPEVIYGTPASPYNPPQWTADKDVWSLNFNAIPNISPKAHAVASPVDVNEGSSCVLDGSGSSDADGFIASYSWAQIDILNGLKVQLSDPESSNPSFIAPDVGMAGAVFTFQLTVTDNDGAKDTAICEAHVLWVDAPPVAVAPDRNVDENSSLTLDGSGSFDEDDGIATYSWKQISGPEIVLSDPSSATPYFTAPYVDDEGMILSFSLTVTDNYGLSGTTTCNVNINNVTHFDGLVTTNKSIDFYGDTFNINGFPAAAGDEIAVYDPSGILCGDIIVQQPGTYGPLHVYGDDITTQTIDEGAMSGDVLTFKVWDITNQNEIVLSGSMFKLAIVYSTPAAPDNPPKWTGDRDSWGLNINAYTYYPLPLKAGWNLISFPVNVMYYIGETPPAVNVFPGMIQQKVDSINQIVKSISGKYTVIRSYDSDGAHTYDPFKPDFLNDLTYMAGGYGYWIKMKEDATLEITGARLDASAPFLLHTGWNLVGCWNPDVMYIGDDAPTVLFPDGADIVQVSAIDDIFNAIDDYYIVIRSYDANGAHTYDPLKPPFLNDLTYVGIGYGYWIKMDHEMDLTY